MNPAINLYARIATLFCSTALFCGSTFGQQPPAAPQPELMLPDPQVLEAGPVHEAFAEPLALDAVELEVIPKQPPEPIQEIPPEIKPEGRNVQWIPGYFMWDQDKADFVWVSGMWRDVPPRRTWIPGEWQQVDGGWQRVPGFWADEREEQLALLPVPPASLDEGPSSPSPGENFLWAPGCWIWQQTGYAWQSGFWYQANPSWVWIPNHYCYTPRGAIFVSGYWDFLPAQRGWLYAPVYWRSGFAGYGGTYFYRPRYLVNSGLLTVSLFINRGYNHYYFGYGFGGGAVPNWLVGWGNNYSPYGFYRGKHAFYDPWWNHSNWHNHGNFPGGHNHGAHIVGKSSLDHGHKMVGRAQDFDFTRTGFNGKGVRRLTLNEANNFRQDVLNKRQDFDRPRIGLDQTITNAIDARRPQGNQGRVLRPGDRGNSAIANEIERGKGGKYLSNRNEVLGEGKKEFRNQFADRNKAQENLKQKLRNSTNDSQVNDFRYRQRNNISGDNLQRFSGKSQTMEDQGNQIRRFSAEDLTRRQTELRNQMLESQNKIGKNLNSGNLQRFQSNSESQVNQGNQIRKFSAEDLARRQAELRSRMLENQKNARSNLNNGNLQNSSGSRNWYRAPTRTPFAEQQNNSAVQNMQQNALRNRSELQQRVFKLPSNQGNSNSGPNLGNQPRFQPRIQADNSSRIQSQQNFRPSGRGTFQGTGSIQSGPPPGRGNFQSGSGARNGAGNSSSKRRR